MVARRSPVDCEVLGEQPHLLQDRVDKAVEGELTAVAEDLAAVVAVGALAVVVEDRVLEDLEKLKISPSNFTVGILVKMYGRRMLDKAFQVAEDMPKRWGFAPNPQVYRCLMSAGFLNNNLPRALQVFEDLRGQGADFKNYNVLITGFLRAGKSCEAACLVEEAFGLNGQKRGLPHDQRQPNLGADCRLRP